MRLKAASAAAGGDSSSCSVKWAVTRACGSKDQYGDPGNARTRERVSSRKWLAALATPDALPASNPQDADGLPPDGSVRPRVGAFTQFSAVGPDHARRGLSARQPDPRARPGRAFRV